LPRRGKHRSGFGLALPGFVFSRATLPARPANALLRNNPSHPLLIIKIFESKAKAVNFMEYLTAGDCQDEALARAQENEHGRGGLADRTR